MNRRQFLKNSALLGLSSTFYPTSDLLAAATKRRLKYIVLGIDGMDIKLASTFMRMGMLPNFSKLAAYGSFTSASTSFPPQSPVAWSSFSVGGPPALHGIYDFIHRDPATMTPYLSTSKVSGAEKTLKLGDMEIPLKAGTVKNLRQGKPFWDYLADHDIPATIFKMPGNFPCQSARVNMISGMGTPDLRGGYGSFTLVTSSPPDNADKITGGAVLPISFNNGYAQVILPGPENSLISGHPTTEVPIQIWRDANNDVVRIVIQDHEFILNKGDWTGWLQLSFTMLKYISDVKGICKLYIKNVHPEFSMYISPINIDPSDPVLPIVSSDDYGKELARNLGAFYTQGMPEDTKALSYDILNNAEYLDLAYQIINERRSALSYCLDTFNRQNEGLLFFYFSSLDQDSHMFWRTIDPKSPLYTPELAEQFGSTLRDLYITMDKCLGDVMERFDISDPSLRLIVTSDHGFGPFRRQVNLNSWLYENGFISLYNSNNIEEGEYFADVNWDKSAAYALGINAIYLNIEGRDRFGMLPQSMTASTLKKIRSGLLALRDPANGQKVVSEVLVVPEQEKRLNPQAPDLIVGWNLGYRTSWSSILGGFERETIKDNDDRWSGDHCIDPSLVPSILYSNRKINRPNPSMLDITATILDDYGIKIPTGMTGKPLAG